MRPSNHHPNATTHHPNALSTPGYPGPTVARSRVPTTRTAWRFTGTRRRTTSITCRPCTTPTLASYSSRRKQPRCSIRRARPSAQNMHMLTTAPFPFLTGARHGALPRKPELGERRALWPRHPWRPEPRRAGLDRLERAARSGRGPTHPGRLPDECEGLIKCGDDAMVIADTATQKLPQSQPISHNLP